MQYGMKTRIIEPIRQTFTPLIERLGDKPATRYQEGTIGVQHTENFHYRPTWDAQRELYDPNYSALKLTDPDAYADPRQYYYMPYVTSRAAMHDAFGTTLDYVVERGLLERTPDNWVRLIDEVLVPLRHYESGAQMLYSGATSYTYGATISQCCGYEAFDRIGNAQMISRIGLAVGQQSTEVLTSAKTLWIEAPYLQGLREVEEKLLVEPDWAIGVVGLDLVDELIDAAVYHDLEEAALVGGAGAYSLLIQQMNAWWPEHRKWVDALYKAWVNDAQHGAANRAAIQQAVGAWLPRAQGAVALLAEYADELVGTSSRAAAEQRAADIVDRLRGLGVDIHNPSGA